MISGAVRVPEAARRLGVDGVEVYVLIESGELKARRGPDGLVYVTEQALAAYAEGRADDVTELRNSR